MICSELREVLLPAYAPCTNFKGTCEQHCVWNPPKGHVPRGFGGATAALDAVRLVIVAAEPGNPADGESYEGPPSQMLSDSTIFFTTFLMANNLRRKGRPAPFHRSLAYLLDLCWPNHTITQ